MNESHNFIARVSGSNLEVDNSYPMWTLDTNKGKSKFLEKCLG